MQTVPHADPTPASRRVLPGVSGAVKGVLDPQTGTARILRQEGPRITIEEFRALLISCVLTGASDITVQTDQQPRAEIDGRLYRLTRRPWSPSEVDMILMELYGANNAVTEIKAMKVLDFSYDIQLDDGSRQRFRVNAIGIFGRDGMGVEVTLRALPARTPDLAMVGLDATELAAMTPRDGIVIVAGATGSGKSTTLAAIMRNHLERTDRPVKIIDIQAPIEFTYRDVTAALSGSSSIIGQSEVGRHIHSFGEGVRAALRRKPHIISVGEARDLPTIAASIEAAQTNHLVYTTTHAGTVSDTIRRLLSVFPGEERDSRALDLASALRFVTVQHLLPAASGVGRAPVREYLRFTDRVRRALFSRPLSEWPEQVFREVQGESDSHGPDDLRMSLTEACDRLVAAGRVRREDALRLTETLKRDG